MLKDIISQGCSTNSPKEGELYKSVSVKGKIFDLYYGYYEEFERGHNDPMPIYPDLKKSPHYTEDGLLIVTGMQDICSHYNGSDDGDSCIQCAYFEKCEELFGICGCPKNKKDIL